MLTRFALPLSKGKQSSFRLSCPYVSERMEQIWGLHFFLLSGWESPGIIVLIALTHSSSPNGDVAVTHQMGTSRLRRHGCREQSCRHLSNGRTVPLTLYSSNVCDPPSPDWTIQWWRMAPQAYSLLCRPSQSPTKSVCQNPTLVSLSFPPQLVTRLLGPRFNEILSVGESHQISGIMLVGRAGRTLLNRDIPPIRIKVYIRVSLTGVGGNHWSPISMLTLSQRRTDTYNRVTFVNLYTD